MHNLTDLLHSIGFPDLQKKEKPKHYDIPCHWYKIQHEQNKKNFNNKIT